MSTSVEASGVSAGGAGPAGAANAQRLASIDIVRGAVMVLMAIDHVRVFSGVPAGGPTPGIFFTRWITNFCAPAFIFLAGTSAFLYGRRHADLSRFLLLRGLWLVLLELTIVRVGWTFNLDFSTYLLAGVLWAIGWCMVLMAGLVRLPVAAVGYGGVAVIALHNATMPALVPLLPVPLRAVLYTAFQDPPLGPLMVLYSIIPWIGVMAAGYGFGALVTLEPARRDRMCYAIGGVSILLFLVLRGFNLYGDPKPWTSGRVPAALAFINTTKYPASLSFLLMTLGPTIALMPWLERASGAVARWLTVFGRVPFFFYLLHIPLIHALAVAVSAVRQGQVSPWLFTNHPMGNPPPPDGYTWSLGLLYLVWAMAIAILYVACRWFADLKARRTEAWLKFL
ncbi:MAG TPA: heparan-alpha-glucosaminide N-acetyltransferase domain-containing protein [Gemmatimonadales bacterium]|nr:heparan-alpha-glucosaminide N-acetyltransferase domain-containing protein [Gemmatimonadales bacterium]